MITEERFKAIQTQVTDSINQAFDRIRERYPENYVLFLAEGEYKAKYINSTPAINPYVIDDREDHYIDETRMNFLLEFMRTFYRFPKHASVDNSEIRLNMEMMIYSHTWESVPFLKKLFRLAHLATGDVYEWNVKVPRTGKHNFIINEVRDKLQGVGLSLADIVTNGYHASLRNAFAHSQYAFDKDNNCIWLDNYTGEDWEIRRLSYDDWSCRFSYTVLLNYHLLQICHERRTALPTVFKSNSFPINYPSRQPGTPKLRIIYNTASDMFSFEH